MDTPSATSSSYGGNPLACAAGAAVLHIVAAPGFLPGVSEMGRRLAAGLDALAESATAVARPRGVGMMLGFDLIDPDTGELASATQCAAAFRACRDHGLLLTADVPRVRLNAPLTLSAGEADQLMGILHEVLA